MQTTRRTFIAGGSALAASAAVGLKPGAVGAQEKTKISWWHIFTVEELQQLAQTAADTFVASHPNVEIEITILENESFKQKLSTSMQSGEPPDIFQSWGGGVLYEYADAGLVKDITADLATDGWGDSFGQAGLGLYGKDGKTYGVPWTLGMVGFWYNKAQFAQAGIETPPKTWAELLAITETLKGAGIIPFTVGEKDKWPGHFYWVYLAIRNGGKAAFDAAYTRTGSFADAPFVKAGEDLKQLVDLDPFQPDFLAHSFPDSSANFAQGKGAMELMGQWSPGSVLPLVPEADREAFRANIGWFPFPVVEGGSGDPDDVLGGGDGYAIGKNASPEAVEFVRYLTSLDIQKEWASKGFAVPPVIKGAEVAVTDPLFTDLMATLSRAKYFQLYYDQFLPPAIGGVVADSTQGLLAGTISAQDAADAIEASAAAELS